MKRLIYAVNQKFKILQLTDLHLREYPFDEKDMHTFEMICSIVEKECPDLIIFTGDMVWGTIIDNPLRSYEAFIEFCNTLEPPIAITYGNHDTNHDSVTRVQFRALETRLKNPAIKTNVSMYESRESYTLEIFSHDRTHVQQLLFIIDSGTYSTSIESRYDWISEEQIDWLHTVLQSYNKKELQEVLVFIHIPLEEFYDAYVSNQPYNDLKEDFRVDYPEINGGFFDALLKEPLVKGLFVGHNHNNNFQTVYQGLMLAFGQVSGYGADSLIRRGARVIELSSHGFDTYRVYDETSNIGL